MSINYTKASDDQSAYDAANDTLAGRLDRLSELVSSLRNRLEPALEPRLGNVASEKGIDAPKEMSAPVVASLEHHAYRAGVIGEEIGDLLQRICL